MASDSHERNVLLIEWAEETLALLAEDNCKLQLPDLCQGAVEYGLGYWDEEHVFRLK